MADSPPLLATHAHVVHAWDALHHALTPGREALSRPDFDEGHWCAPAAPCPPPPRHRPVAAARALQENLTAFPLFFSFLSALFVTWDVVGGGAAAKTLRGCIGTLEPRPLRAALSEYAVTAALRDRRFAPIAPRELPRLACTVSLLHSFEAGAAWDDWAVGVHGVLIHFADPGTGVRRSATFLPEIAAAEGWSRAEALEALVRKAGCGAGAAAVRGALRLTRYQSSAATLGYDDWCAAKAAARPRARRAAKAGAGDACVTVPA